jgi:hypothetical protein
MKQIKGDNFCVQLYTKTWCQTSYIDSNIHGVSLVEFHNIWFIVLRLILIKNLIKSVIDLYSVHEIVKLWSLINVVWQIYLPFEE